VRTEFDYAAAFAVLLILTSVAYHVTYRFDEMVRRFSRDVGPRVARMYTGVPGSDDSRGRDSRAPGDGRRRGGRRCSHVCSVAVRRRPCRTRAEVRALGKCAGVSRRPLDPHRGAANPVKGGTELRVGPVEYLVLEFPDHRFHGEITPPLARLIDTGTVRIIDLVFIRKEPDGSVVTFEFDELEELAPYAKLQGEAGGVITQEDIDYAAAGLHSNAAAVVIIWEDTWAAELGDAVRRANGTLVEGGRIPADEIESVLAGLAVPNG
jgi:hypothetical protein